MELENDDLLPAPPKVKPEQRIDVEEDAKILKKEEPKKKEKEKIDIFNDPLLPEEPVRKGRGSEKKKVKGGSFNGDKDVIDDDQDINYEDLDENEKYQVLQHLYEEYQKDPENFPEDQRQILEQELKDLFDQEEEEMSDDE